MRLLQDASSPPAKGSDQFGPSHWRIAFNAMGLAYLVYDAMCTFVRVASRRGFAAGWDEHEKARREMARWPGDAEETEPETPVRRPDYCIRTGGPACGRAQSGLEPCLVICRYLPDRNDPGDG